MDSRVRWIAVLMGLEAISLAVMSTLHLAGALTGAEPFDPTRAGFAEAAIGVALAAGAVALMRAIPHAWGVAIAANVFAVVGFAVGLTRTIQGGGVVDVGYHLTVLPLILLTLVLLLRVRPRAHGSEAARRTARSTSARARDCT